jgi:hypothetical protein
MGTSASNGGPKGAPPLLPDWYPDAPTTPEPERENPAPQPDEVLPTPDGQPVPAPELPLPANTPTGDWKSSKGALTRLSNNTSGSSGRKAAGRYLNSLGGAGAATRAAAQGVRVGNSYAGFLGALGSGGVTNVLNTLGLSEFIGRSPDEICAAIADSLAPVGSTNDEAIARDALITTLDALYTQILEAGGDLDSLSSLSPEMVKETLMAYVSNFIFTKWMYELGNAIERGNITETQAISLEHEVRDLIQAETIEHYRDLNITQLNLNDADNTALITNIFETAYSTLEP